MQVRPLIDLEKAKKAKDCVQVQPPNKIKLPPMQLGSTNTEAYNFDYDRVYKLDSKEESRRLFAELVQPLLDRYLQGFNVTVSADPLQCSASFAGYHGRPWSTSQMSLMLLLWCWHSCATCFWGSSARHS